MKLLFQVPTHYLNAWPTISTLCLSCQEEIAWQLANEIHVILIGMQLCTELLWDKMNTLRQKSLDQIDNDITMMSSLLC